MTRSTASAVARPSPVGRCSVRMTCPDCSPPRRSRPRSISSITYLSPTRRANQADAARLEAPVSRPMLLITVATTVSPASRPCADTPAPASAARRRRRRRARGRSTKIARSPSPSNATPSRQLLGDDGAPRAPAGCVDPQSRLILRPSGRSPIVDQLESQPAEQRARPSRSSRRWPCRGRCGRRRATPGVGQDPSRRGRGRRRRAAPCAIRGSPPAARTTTASATTASTARSSASPNFSPRPENTLMPLSPIGIVRRREHHAESRSPARRRGRQPPASARRRRWSRARPRSSRRAPARARSTHLTRAYRGRRRSGRVRRAAARGPAPRRAAPPSAGRAARCRPRRGRRRCRTVVVSRSLRESSALIGHA